MMIPFLRRRRPPASALLDAPRAGIGRMREALPESGLADVFVDLAARSGIDLGEVAQRVFDRLGEVAVRAEEEASGLAESDTAKQLRDLAARAAGRAAELAYRTGAERLLEAMPQRRRRSRRRAIFISAGLGLVAGGTIAYVVMSQLSRRNPSEEAAARAQGGESAGGPGAALTQAGEQAITKVTAPVQGFIGRLQHRLQVAGRAARAEQATTERKLWSEYENRGVQDGDWPAHESPGAPHF